MQLLTHQLALMIKLALLVLSLLNLLEQLLVVSDVVRHSGDVWTREHAIHRCNQVSVVPVTDTEEDAYVFAIFIFSSFHVLKEYLLTEAHNDVLASMVCHVLVGCPSTRLHSELVDGLSCPCHQPRTQGAALVEFRAHTMFQKMS